MPTRFSTTGIHMYNVGVDHSRVYEYFNQKHENWLRNAGINFYALNIKESELDTKSRTLVTGWMAEGDLDHFPNLEAVVVPFAAINQLDLDALSKRGIKVFHTSAHARFVAERALVLTLSVLGKIVYFHKQLEKGEWAGRVDGKGGSSTKWTTLSGKKVAIYGYGSVGNAFHTLIRPFNVKVGTVSYKNRIAEGVESFETIAEMAGWCDVFIVSVPLNEHTEGSINKKVFSELRNSVLINIGRGSIVEEASLFASLSNNELKGFGSDVWYNDPTTETPKCPPSNYPLESFDNVVMTPHNGGSEEHSDAIKYIDVAEQLSQISKGDYSRQVR